MVEMDGNRDCGLDLESVAVVAVVEQQSTDLLVIDLDDDSTGVAIKR